MENLQWFKPSEKLPEVTPIMEGSVRRESKQLIFYYDGRSRLGVYVDLDPKHLTVESECYFESGGRFLVDVEHVEAWAYFSLPTPLTSEQVTLTLEKREIRAMVGVLHQVINKLGWVEMDETDLFQLMDNLADELDK